MIKVSFVRPDNTAVELSGVKYSVEEAQSIINKHFASVAVAEVEKDEHLELHTKINFITCFSFNPRTYSAEMSGILIVKDEVPVCTPENCDKLNFYMRGDLSAPCPGCGGTGNDFRRKIIVDSIKELQKQ